MYMARPAVAVPDMVVTVVVVPGMIMTVSGMIVVVVMMLHSPTI